MILSAVNYNPIFWKITSNLTHKFSPSIDIKILLLPSVATIMLLLPSEATIILLLPLEATIKLPRLGFCSPKIKLSSNIYSFISYYFTKNVKHNFLL